MRLFLGVTFLGAVLSAPLAQAELSAPSADIPEAGDAVAAPAPVAEPAAPPAAEPAAEPAPVAAEPAPAPSAADAAREALQQKEEDTSAQKNLEEVFQATEKQYSLLKSGAIGLDYSFSYSYFRDDRIDIAFNDSGQLSRFRIENDAQHSFSNTLSADYGIFDNLTFSLSLPLIFKFDTQKDNSAAALGDASLGLRWQPFPVKRGAPVTTLFGSFSTATGDSPYEINTNTDVASGKGYYSMSGGASTSKLLDPAVIFGSISYTMAFDATDLNQNRGSRVLYEVHPGDSIGFSMGLAYSLSYDLSISASYQQSYSFETEFLFMNGDVVGTEDSTSSVVNMSLGIRTSPTRIVNVSFGYGLTEDSPDVFLGFSLPIEVSGLRQ
jgi:hypothetical protein